MNKQNAFPSERISLPVYQEREKILEAVRKHSVIILVGETGSGKTTQLPQILLEDRLLLQKGTSNDRGKDTTVAVTQPRRVAAISIAHRVALEMGVKVGKKVGYSVRFDEKFSKHTKLKYLTDGMLLREAMIDPLFKRYTIVILDEAHERSVATDILFGVVKRALHKRASTFRPLKVIVMSATLDVGTFLDYFEPDEKTNAFARPLAIYIEGRQFPVKMLYTIEPQLDYVDSTIVSILQICKHEKQKTGDILAFLTGQDEIESCAELLEERSRLLPSDSHKLVVCMLFAALPANEQLKVFEPTPEHSRKVILATNIAETSITVPGIRFVVDCGLVKAKSFQPGSGLQLLKVTAISKSQAWQRSGRAGREGPGKCYRLYTEKDFEKLREKGTPEIMRIDLAQVVLQILSLQLGSINDFDFLEAPSPKSLQAAYFTLLALGAIDTETKSLTRLGKDMAGLPLEPAHSKFLLESFRFGCTEEALTISAMFSVESPFFTPKKYREAASTSHSSFHSDIGDHIVYLNVFHSYCETGFDKQWCKSHFLKATTLAKANKIRVQLQRMLCKVKNTTEKFTSCTPEVEPILKCLVNAFAFQVAKRISSSSLEESSMAEPRKRKRQLQWQKPEYKTMMEGLEVSIHPSSSLFKTRRRPEWICFNEVVFTSKRYLKGVSKIEEQWLVELAPSLYGLKKVKQSSIRSDIRQTQQRLRQHIMVD